MDKVIIFGAGKIADEAYFYLTNDSPYEVVAFCVDGAHVPASSKLGLPVIPAEEIEQKFPPADYKMFVAIGYQELNHLRAQKCEEAKARGYHLISYVSSRASNVGKVEIGENCFILEFAVIQPCARIGNNVFIWSGNHIGHHATVQDHCYIAGNVVISGNTVIEPYCFLGVSSTIGHEITIGAESFIGAGSLITKKVEPKSVYVTSDTQKFRLDSASFLRLTKMK